jgi:hypothetical protein
MTEAIQYHSSLSPERIEMILGAKEAWGKWATEERSRAEKGFALHESANTGFAVVAAYDLELQTGKPHCACCMRPSEIHRRF